MSILLEGSMFDVILLSASGRDVRKNHKDYDQVVLDVRRSKKRFPKGAFVCVLSPLVVIWSDIYQALPLLKLTNY